MQSQLLRRSKISKYHVIRHSQNKIQKGTSHQHKNNIFNNSHSKSEYFPTSPASQIFPFSAKNHIKTSAAQSQMAEQLFITNDRKQKSLKIPTQTIYKLNNYNSYRSNTINDLKSQVINDNINKMPPIPMHIKIPSLDQNMVNLTKRTRNFTRWDRKVDKFLYQQSIVSEVVYNSDLRSRCGDQYFEQNLRDRHKDQMKPIPFVYSIKNNVPPQNKFIQRVQQIHPQIKIRTKLKVKGINRLRIKTEQGYQNFKIQ